MITILILTIQMSLNSYFNSISNFHAVLIPYTDQTPFNLHPKVLLIAMNYQCYWSKAWNYNVLSLHFLFLVTCRWSISSAALLSVCSIRTDRFSSQRPFEACTCCPFFRSFLRCLVCMSEDRFPLVYWRLCWALCRRAYWILGIWIRYKVWVLELDLATHLLPYYTISSEKSSDHPF